MRPENLSERGEHDGQFWALVPFGNRSPITKPVFFHSPDEVRRCWSVPIFAGWGESKALDSRAAWIEAVESDVQAPTLPSLCEELARSFSSPKPSKSILPGAKATVAELYEQWLGARSSEEATVKLAEYVLERYGFRAYRMYMSIDKKRAARILRSHGSEAFLQFIMWRRRCINLPDLFQSPAPVHRRCDDRGPICNLRLSDYVKPDELNPVSGGLDTLLSSCLANPLVQHCLYPDWNFAEIQRRANHSHWHQAPERKLKIGNARVYFARVALELDDALRARWPNLSATARQAFWTSWEASEHLKQVEQRIEQYVSEPGAVIANRGELAEAQSAVESIIRHYVIECLQEVAHASLQANEDAECIASQVCGDRGSIANLDVPYEAHRNAEVTNAAFGSVAERNQALREYLGNWCCSQASLARAARVDPADLSKWKKKRLPNSSNKKARIEEALKKNTPPLESKTVRVWSRHNFR